jgi:hypothetical protein
MWEGEKKEKIRVRYLGGKEIHHAIVLLLQGFYFWRHEDKY